MSSYLFIGRFLSPFLLSTFKSDFKGRGGLSNHNFEMSLIKGISDNVDEFRCLSMPQTASYPHHYSRFYCKAEDYMIGEVPVHGVGLCNLVLVNILWKEFAMYNAIKHELNCFKDQKVNVIVNCAVNSLMRPLFKAAKSVNKTIETALIVPDIPSLVTSTVSTSSNSIRNYFVDVMNRNSMKIANCFDHYVFLTDQMKDLFPKKDYIVMEGLIDVSKLVDSSASRSEQDSTQSLLYSGSLHEVYGILDLLRVFINGNFENTELWICGSGNAMDKVAAAAAKYPSIKYYGLVSADQARDLQRKATILINPRKNEGDYVKYSFPSKTMEYLLAKKPVIMNYLPGVPVEYYKYVYTPVDPSDAGLQEVILRVLNMDKKEREKKAQQGYDFIINNKNAKFQMKRVLELFNS